MLRGGFARKYSSEHHAGGHERAQNVGRNLDIDRSGFAAIAECARDGFVQFAQYLIRHARGYGTPRDRSQDLDVRNAL